MILAEPCTRCQCAPRTLSPDLTALFFYYFFASSPPQTHGQQYTSTESFSNISRTYTANSRGHVVGLRGRYTIHKLRALACMQAASKPPFPPASSPLSPLSPHFTPFAPFAPFDTLQGNARTEEKRGNLHRHKLARARAVFYYIWNRMEFLWGAYMLLRVRIICGYARMVEGKMYIYTKKNWTFFFIFFVCTFFLLFLFFSRLVHFFCVLAYTGNCMWRRGVPELHPSSDSYLAKVVNLIPPHRYILGYRYIASILYIYLFFLFSSSFLPLLLLFFLLLWMWNFHNISKVHLKKLQKTRSISAMLYSMTGYDDRKLGLSGCYY